MGAICSRISDRLPHRIKTEATEKRNENLDCCEKSFQVLCVLLLGFGVIMLVTGVSFIKHDLWQESQFGLDRVKVMASVLVGVYAFLTCLFACFGILIAKNRQCGITVTACYGILVFFIIAIPLLSEGTAFTKLHKIENERIQELCDWKLEDIHREHNRIVFAFFDFAHRFDRMSEQLLDRYMCTDLCPCLDNGESPSSSKEVFKKEAEKVLKHNRTFDPSVKDKVFMKFEEDPKQGFRNFDSCYAYWRKKKEVDPSIDLEKLFYLSYEDLFLYHPYRPKRGRGDTDVRHKAKFILTHLNEIEMYEDLEDEYRCSGMCKSSLFYFGNDLKNGPPKETCLIKFKEFIGGSAQGFAYTSILTGVVALFVFIGHFGLYFRPIPARPPIEARLKLDLDNLVGATEMPNLPDDDRAKNYEVDKEDNNGA